MTPDFAETTMDEYLAEARAGLQRVAAVELWGLVDQGALLVDIRPLEQRERDGELPGATVIGMNVLEWRLAPSSPDRVIDLDAGQKVILVCDQGYSSSLAAARLQRLGIPGATDLVDGFQALLRAGIVERH